MRTHPTVLVLAASTYQLPFIAAAKQAGCRVLTVDNRPENPGHRLADQSLFCDTTDTCALVAIAREHRIDGVIAAATDVALDAAAEIASALGIPGPSPHCTGTLTRKVDFRMLQRRLSLPAPAFALAPQGIDFPSPWIVKPNRASGSKGIRIVDSMPFVEDAWQDAIAASVDGRALVEHCLQGRQGTLEGVMFEGRIAASIATDRRTASAPAVGTRGHRVPGDFHKDTIINLHSQIERVFSEYKYGNGPFDADFLAGTDGHAYLLELTPRAGGNSLVRMLKHAAGFDMPDYVVKTALGIAKKTAPFDIRPTALEILAASHGGILQYDATSIDVVRAMPGVEHIEMDISPGSRVRPFVDGRDRIGELVVCSDDPADLNARLDSARAMLGLQVT